MKEGDASLVAEAVARRSYGKLVALLTRHSRDIAAAEDALADAFAAALETWPERGTPANPEGWLVTTARRKLIDASRRRHSAEDATAHLQLVAEELEASQRDAPDERLALLFACAHPAIDPGVRAPLILQTILGFDAAAIGSAFLVSPATMGQRLVRAKRKIRDAGIPFRRPDAQDLPERLDAVLDALYAAFGQGWSAADATDPGRELAEDAIWLARLVVSQLPDEPEAQGLLSLMLFAHARRDARRDAEGEYVPLDEQDPARWDAAALEEANAALARANALPEIGRFQLEAAVQSAHAVRRFTSAGSDWPAIFALYDALLAITGSPVVAVNRAIALAERDDPAAGLKALDAIAGEPRLADYQPYWAARADLLARVGDRSAAADAYTRAIGLETDPAIRRFLERRRTALPNPESVATTRPTPQEKK
jgi:RNA polymerase sigma-70 factor (ECF subfamily)